MADDNHFRSYRPADPYAGAGAAPAGNSREGNDPLAELARLIGQNDPFAELRRDGPRGDITRTQQQTAEWHGHPGAPAGFAEPEPTYYEPQQFEPQPYAAAHQASEEFQPAYDPAIYGTPQQGGGGHDGGYYQGPDHHAEGGEGYDDELPAAPRRRGLKTAMLFAGLVLLGAGGAVGYRALLSGGRANTPPPVIAADSSPSKVAAAPKGESSNKLIYDRVGDAGQEKVVSREEQPVDIKDSSRGASVPPRQIFPGIPVSPESLSASTASSAPLGDTASVGPASAEPKKIRTVTIRPDQPLSSAPPPRPIAGTSVAAPPPASVAVSGPSPVRPVKPPAPIMPQPPAAMASAPAATNAPLSLAPQGINDAAQTRTANAAPAPARIAPSDAAGSYVQLSSQRSEPEAQASFRSLQSKFPNLLGSRQPVIRRADLGEKGIYFRAMVGPFASVDEASGFCGNLKSAGGQCVVQRN